MNVLVTGGAGYIGAHLVAILAARGETVVVADDLSTGTANRIGDAELVRVELAQDSAVETLATAFHEHHIDTVVHFAARKRVGESVERPAWYYRENLGSLANLLLAMERHKVQRLLFSSSASVYGPSEGTITEADQTAPISPYGETKLAGEWLVNDAVAAFGLNAVSLRYFNVAGAGSPELGDPAVLNLVPMVFEKLDENESPLIFGADYPTPDGTCIRDYVHVQDVAEAHLAAIHGFETLGNGHHIFNVGTGHGSSVREIIDAILDVSGSTLQPEIAPRRAGDPPSVVASVDLIRERLGWSARLGLDDIIRSAWDAHQFQRKAALL